MSFDDIFIDDDDFEEDDDNDDDFEEDEEDDDDFEDDDDNDDDVEEDDESNKQASPRSVGVGSTFGYTGLHSCKVCDKCGEYAGEPYSGEVCINCGHLWENHA